MATAEHAPDTVMAFSVDTLSIAVSGRAVVVGIPAAVRESFLNGMWDATGLLLDRFDDVRAVAAELPYVKGF